MDVIAHTPHTSHASHASHATHNRVRHQERIAISGVTRDQAQEVALSLFGADREHTYSAWKDHAGSLSFGCHCTRCGAIIVVLHPNVNRLTDMDAYVILADDDPCGIGITAPL